MSPMNNVGSSTVATLIAHQYAYKGHTSLLCYTDNNSPIARYLNITDLDDPTKSINQVMRLVDADAIKPNDILQYTSKFDKNHPAHLMSFGDSTLDDSSKLLIVDNIFNKVTTDLTVCDVSETIDSPLAQAFIKVATVVFIVINPTEKGFKLVKQWLASDIWPNKEYVIPIVNMYANEIDAFERICDRMGLLITDVCKLHFNPYISRCTYQNALHTLIHTVNIGDSKTVNIKPDIEEITKAIDTISFGKPKKFDMKKEIEKFKRQLRR